MVTEVGTAEGSNLYYLSNNIDSFFQRNKIGSKSGKYIVILYEHNGTESVHVQEILEVTDSIMKNKNLSNGSIVIYKAE